MKVMKFGGTSVGSAQRMKEVARLVCNGEKNLVVLSAMSGTTNQLVEISDYLYKKNAIGALEIVNKMEANYYKVIDELYTKEEFKQLGRETVKKHFDYIRTFANEIFTVFEEKIILAQGELMSTAMFNYYLQEQGVKSVLIPALEILKTDKNGEPDTLVIQNELEKWLTDTADAELWITQGYICRNFYGEIDNCSVAAAIIPLHCLVQPEKWRRYKFGRTSAAFTITTRVL